MCNFQSITQSLHYLELHKYFENVMSYLIFLFVCFTVCGLMSFILIKHGKLWRPLST